MGVIMRYGFKQYRPPVILHNHLNLGGESPDGGKIAVNSLYIEKDGVPWIGIMGEMHYVRCERERWREFLSKMKAGGIMVVSTYAFWIYHEEKEGVYDFSGARDVRAFVQLCQEMGLWVVMRIGPWCHGEVRNGGFPDWLLRKPYPLREVNEDFMEVTKTWYGAVAEQLRGLFYKDGGNIIAVQIENEFVDNADYLLALKRLAIQCGMQAPVYTVTGWNRASGAKIPVDDVLPLFGGYCDAPWDESITRLPPSSHYFFTGVRNDSSIGKDLIAAGEDEDGWRLPYERYPHATCEIGGGLQSTYLRRYRIKGMDIYAMALIKLCEGANLIGYYMYCGGENLIGEDSTLQETKESGFPNDYPILNYDFEAPVSMYGEIREHYRLLNLLHLFLLDFGRALAKMTFVPAEISAARDDTKTLRYGMRTDGHSGYIFVNHYQRLDRLEDVSEVVFEAFDVKFPPIAVTGEISFFLPFHMDLEGTELLYATAQPLCRVDRTFFFLAIPGIDPVYQLNGEKISAAAGKENGFCRGSIRIVTLKMEEALFARKLGGTFYIGERCDLYLLNGALQAAAGKERKAVQWKDQAFVQVSTEEGRSLEEGDRCGKTYESGHMASNTDFIVPESAGSVFMQKLEEAPFMPDHKLLSEFWFGGEPKLVWYRISTEVSSGFVEIDAPCDVMQIYADGKLAADDFYRGVCFRIPARLLYGKECFLLLSEQKDNCYMEAR